MDPSNNGSRPSRKASERRHKAFPGSGRIFELHAAILGDAHHHLIVVRGVVMEKEQLVRAAIAREMHSVLPGAVTPTFMRLVFLRGILSVADQNVGASRIATQNFIELRVTMLVVGGVDDYDSP